MPTKTIRFDYFKPCLLSRPDETVNLLPYIKKLQSIVDINKQEIKCSNSTYVSVSLIKLHENYQLTSGALLPYLIWELRFPRSRIDVPGKINNNTRKIEAVELNDNERIVEETVVLYDPATDICVVEKNQSAASIIHIRTFINNFVDQEENYISFAPMVNMNRLKRALAQKSTHYINLRLSNTNDPEFIEEINKSKNESVKQIVTASNALSMPAEYSVKADLSISIDERQTHKSFILEKAHSFINTLFPFIASDKVDKLVVKGRDPNTDKIEEINLIEDVIRDKHSFSITRKNRYISSIAIFDKMALKYQYRRSYYLKNNS